MGEMRSATVVPFENFNAVADSVTLHDILKESKNNELLINIICSRSNKQRQLFQECYKTQYGKDLIDDIRSNTSGNFENLLVALLTPINHFYAKQLHDAMSGIGTDESVIIEDLCSLPNHDIKVIKKVYEKLYEKKLEDELISDTSGHFKRLVVSLCNANRDESGIVDKEAARQDAADLMEAGVFQLGTDESTFNKVLCQRNYRQLSRIFRYYEQLSGQSLEDAISEEFSGDIKNGLIAIVQCVTNKAEYFAKCLHKSMAGLGTDDDQLIRLIVKRSEVDLNDIKLVFERLYGKSLREWIKDDTSGDYKHTLYALIGEKRSS